MAEEPKPKRFSIKHLPSLLLESGKAWVKDDPWRLGAVVAYYALLSLPGLLIIIIHSVGLIWGQEIVAGRLTGQISSVIGQSAAEAVQSIFANAATDDSSVFAAVLGAATLLFGATGVFYHLQLSINSIWEIKQNPKSNFLRMLLDRVVSFGFVLILGFLLLTSFVISALLGILNEFISSNLPEFAVYLAYALNIIVSLGIISLLFALIFKYLPDAHIKWRSVWMGAIITAILFTIGKELLGLYFGEADPGSTYGAAGSLVLILLWVSYSCLILFFGAEFSWVYAKRYGHGVRPKKHSMLVTVTEVVTKKTKQQVG